MKSYKAFAAFSEGDVRSLQCSAHRSAQLTVGSLRGKLFLAVSVMIFLGLSQMALAQTEKVLYSFCSMANCADGSDPAGNLIADAAGNFYSTTAAGGIVGGLCQNFGCGTVFELTAAGTIKKLYSFTGSPDGNNPVGGLVRDSKGNLYGATASGGNAGGVCGTYGCGTVFELLKTGATYTEKVLYAFTGGADGAIPGSGLVRDTSGNLYGTTNTGGGSGCSSSSGCGTVFEITAAGNEQVLYAFTGNADGATPSASLVLDGVGNLYGTTAYGGNFVEGCLTRGCGVVFKVTSAGQESVLYAFTGSSDGQWPMAPLIRDAKGNLYGTTLTGGDVTNVFCDLDENGCGVVFEVTSKGVMKTLYSFTGYPADGQHSFSGLVRDKQGNFYGTTDWGGPSNDGTVFKVTPGGVETVLHSFVGGTDGLDSHSGLALDAKGNLYGTTLYGGSFGDGVLFKVTP